MFRKILIGGVTAAAIVGAGGAALAASGGNSATAAPSPSTQSTSAHHPHQHGKGARGHRLLRHLDHADVVLHTKKRGEVHLALIRGTVSSVSSSSITVVSADRTTQTFTISKDTKVRSRSDGKRTDASVSDVATGDRVFVAGVGASNPVARRVVDRGTK